MYSSNVLLLLLSQLFAQVIVSFGIIVLWNPIKRASQADGVIASLKNELPWLLPSYIIIKIIENYIIISMSYTRTLIDSVELTVRSIILAAIFVVACSFTIKWFRQKITNQAK